MKLFNAELIYQDENDNPVFLNESRIEATDPLAAVEEFKNRVAAEDPLFKDLPLLAAAAWPVNRVKSLNPIYDRYQHDPCAESHG